MPGVASDPGTAPQVLRLDEIEALPGPGTLLSFGGSPTFTPSAWEWSFRATAVLQSDRHRARSILKDGLGAHPEDPSLLYNLACAEALDGHGPAAIEHLRRAIAGRPEVADWARGDADFGSLGDDPAFR